MYLNKLGLQFQEPQQLKVTNTELQSFNWPPTICMQMAKCTCLQGKQSHVQWLHVVSDPRGITCTLTHYHYRM